MIVIYRNSKGDLVATDKEVPESEVIAYANEYGITDRPLTQEHTLIELDFEPFLGEVFLGHEFELPHYGIFKYINPQLN